MIDPLPCPHCAFANALGAETCAECGTPLAETPERVHPGETLRDPDDLTLPPSPLLRAVLRGAPDAYAGEARGRGATAAPSSPAATPVAAPADTIAMPVAAPTDATIAAPAPDPVPEPVAPPVTKATVAHLSPSADQAALLRDLAERLHARRTEPVVRYAGFFVRVVAFLIDGVLLGAFGLPLAAAGYWGIRAGLMVLGHDAPIEPDETLVTLLMVAWFAMATAYFTILHHTYGQTIGKSFVGIAVRTLHLHEVGYGRALLRTLAYALSSSFFGFGFLLVALTPRKRGWHDFLAGTRVVRLDAEEASA